MSTPKPKNKEKKQRLEQPLLYSGMAFKMAAVITVGTFSGRKLDEISSLSFPLWTMTLALCSVALSIYIAIKDLSR